MNVVCCSLDWRFKGLTSPPMPVPTPKDSEIALPVHCAGELKKRGESEAPIQENVVLTIHKLTDMTGH